MTRTQTSRRSVARALLGLFAAMGWQRPGSAQALPKAECVAGAKAGGGFDLTCRLATEMLATTRELRTTYLPGGIGAVAFTTFATKRRGERASLVAFSSGSLLNLAQGKFGPYTEADVTWLAIVAVDYGVIAVRNDSPFKSLADVAKALRSDLRNVTIGAGGTLGSQDWFKAALLARAAGVNHKSMRFVAFEGGGDAIAALRGGHVSLFAGDAAELSQFVGKGEALRVLAVLSKERLGGVYANVPTAREQGFEVVWPIARGFYLGPDVPDADVRAWSETLRQAMNAPDYPTLLARHGLQPQALTGEPLQAFIASEMTRYRQLVAQFQMMRAPR